MLSPSIQHTHTCNSSLNYVHLSYRDRVFVVSYSVDNEVADGGLL